MLKINSISLGSSNCSPPLKVHLTNPGKTFEIVDDMGDTDSRRSENAGVDVENVFKIATKDPRMRQSLLARQNLLQIRHGRVGGGLHRLIAGLAEAGGDGLAANPKATMKRIATTSHGKHNRPLCQGFKAEI